MRVALISDCYLPRLGGIEVQVHDLALQLQSAGHEVTVITATDGGPGVIEDGMLYVQAAAGVVADSIPESEWQETESKARAVLRAAELVQAGLQ